MKVKMLFIASFLTISACQSSASQSDVEIENLKSGLACIHEHDSSDGSFKIDPHICFETEDIYITGQGRCTFDGKKYPCTWYGYEFDYVNNTDTDITMVCEVLADEHSVYGNPDGLDDPDINRYEVTLSSGRNHFSNPQYTLFKIVSEKTAKKQITTCSVTGREIFTVKYTIHMPIKG